MFFNYKNNCQLIEALVTPKYKTRKRPMKVEAIIGGNMPPFIVKKQQKAAETILIEGII